MISARAGSTLGGELTRAGVPLAAADGLTHAGDAVATGVAPVSPSKRAQLRAAVVEGSGRAFGNGLHAASALTGALCVVGAVVAAVGIRTSAASAGPHRPTHAGTARGRSAHSA